MATYFRMDGWVKTALGAAIPGAQVYICNQPANTDSAPPTPLATIYSDVNGLVPITQPILTDGFGHYDFYTSVGAYTVVIAYGGTILEVYPDQSVGGGSSSGGTGLTLEINGVLASSQLVQNLKSGGSVVVADAGSGDITITGNTIAAGSGISVATVAGVTTITNTSTGIAAGANIIPIPSLNTTANFPASVESAANAAGASNTFVQYVAGNYLYATPSSWNVTIKVGASTSTITMQVVKCAVGSNVVLSTTAVTFGGLTSPSLSSGLHTSDNISLPLSPAFDYFFLVNSSTGLLQILAPATNQPAGTGVYIQASNMIGQSTLTFTGGSVQVGKSIIFALNAA